MTPPCNRNQAKDEQRCRVVVNHYGEDDEETASATLAVDFHFIESSEEDKETFLDMCIFLADPVTIGPNDLLNVRLTPKTARSIAYSLLWYANDLEGE